MGANSVWVQATLPVKFGSLGVRRATQLAPSAFLASAASCSKLITKILPADLNPGNASVLDLAVSAWQHFHDYPPPPESVSHMQKAWDFLVLSTSYDSLLDVASDPSYRVRLLAVASKESGAWLSALPISSVGLRMEKRLFKLQLASDWVSHCVFNVMLRWTSLAHMVLSAALAMAAMQGMLLLMKSLKGT